MKFKVGDRVKVIARKHGHFFDNGEVVKIKEVTSEGYMCSSLERNNIWWLKDDEVDEVKFTKSDLKDGDIVTYRNGDKRTIISGKLINEDGYISKHLRNYTDELKNTTSTEDLDIVKVARPVKYETMFERKEEILDETEKRYLANVIRPFRHKIKDIKKEREVVNNSLCYIKISLKNNYDTAFLPDFEENSMYRGMKPEREYTLKELGL